MPRTCRNCKRTFSSTLQYELHRDGCSAEALICRVCGDRTPQRLATRDGWHYACPTEDCPGAGLGEDLHPVGDFRVLSTSR